MNQYYKSHAAVKEKEELRILLIEDDESHAELISMNFTHKKSGTTLFNANDVSEALSMIEEFEPDVIISDYNLPEGNIVEEFREKNIFYNYPVIILTSFGDENKAVEAIKSGAVDYIIKNEIIFNDMTRIVERILREWGRILENRAAQKALRESESKFKALFDQSMDVIIQVDEKTGIILDVNRSVKIVMGYDQAELKGKSFTVLFEEDSDLDQQELRQRITSQGIALATEGFLKADGSIIPMDMTASFLRLERNRSIMLTLRDITERKKAEEEISKLNQTLESTVQKRTSELSKTNQKLQSEISEKQLVEKILREREKLITSIYEIVHTGICLISEDGKFIHVNEAFSRIFGYSQNDMIDKSVSMLFKQNKSHEFKKFFLDFHKSKENDITEWEIETADGKHKYIEISAARVAENTGPDIIVASVIDRTSKKIAETEMKNSLKREREVNQLKSRFISMVSHDFRTPLTSILTSAEMIVDYGERWSDEKKQHYLNKIIASVGNMNSLLEDVLFIGRSDAGKIEVNEVSVNIEAFLNGILEEAEFINGGRNKIITNYEGSCSEYLVDEKLLRQILTNLLSNALKYSPGGEEVLFTCECSDDELRFIIKDNGIGIAEDHLKKLYETFNRGKNIGNIQGTGLGMSIVKRSLNVLNGKIDCESRLGEGTTFFVTVPAEKNLPE